MYPAGIMCIGYILHTIATVVWHMVTRSGLATGGQLGHFAPESQAVLIENTT